MVNRVVVGAHYGLRDWLVQRISAVIMALYTVVLSGYLLMQPRLNYDVWTELFSSQVMRSFTLLFLLSLFYHAWLGVRDIVLVQTSCGMAVPFFSYTEERTQLKDWAIKKGEDGIQNYWQEKNQISLDGKPTGISQDT